jgi:hypothetical protein
MKAVATAIATMIMTSNRGAPAAGPPDELAPGPRGDPAGVRALAHDEQRGDEDHRGVAEAGQRLVDAEHAGRVQQHRPAQGDQFEGYAVPHEQHHDQAQHREAERHVTHGARFRSLGRRDEQELLRLGGPAGHHRVRAARRSGRRRSRSSTAAEPSTNRAEVPGPDLVPDPLDETVVDADVPERPGDPARRADGEPHQRA